MPSPQTARARLAAATKHGHGESALTELRRELLAANLEQHIRRTVDTYPPLTNEQRDRLAVLLRPSTTDGRPAR